MAVSKVWMGQNIHFVAIFIQEPFDCVPMEIIEPQAETSEIVDCLQKFWKLTKKNKSNEKITENGTEQRKVQTEGSKFNGYSQNSWNRNKVGIFELKYEEQPLKKWSLLESGKPGKQLQNSQADFCVKVTEQEEVKEINLPLKPGQLHELQKNDAYCRDIIKKWHKKVEMQMIFIKENDILYCLWSEDGKNLQVYFSTWSATRLHDHFGTWLQRAQCFKENLQLL